MVSGLDGGEIIRTREEFDRRLEAGWENGVETVQSCITNLGKVYGAVLQGRSLASGKHPAAWDATMNDLQAQMKVLTAGEYVMDTPTRWLWCIPRFVRAMEVRLTRIRNTGPERDERMIRSVAPWVQCVRELREQGAHQDDAVAEQFEELFWLVQEYRVAVFAQELRTSVPVSEKRLRQQLDTIIGG